MISEHQTDIAKNQLRDALRTLRDDLRRGGQTGQAAIDIVNEVSKEVVREVISEAWPEV